MLDGHNVVAAWLAGSVGLAWLLLRCNVWRSRLALPGHDKLTPLKPEEALAAQETALQPPQPEEPVTAEGGHHEQHRPGARVQFRGLCSAPELNGACGVVHHYDPDIDRFAVRKEVAREDEPMAVMVKASKLRPAPPHDSLAALQRLVDAAPAGSRVTLPRGTVSADADAAEAPTTKGDEPKGDEPKGDEPGALILRTAITLSGMGSRSGGTVLNFSVVFGPEMTGDVVELSELHVRGTVDVTPEDVRRVRLVRVCITAPMDKPHALLLEEIGWADPPKGGVEERVLLEGCWLRGGNAGVVVSAAGVTLRGCRIQGAGTFGVLAKPTFAHVRVEGCTIGDCAKSGWGGGILSRAGVTQLGPPLENRIQTDQYDKGYSGYRQYGQNHQAGCVCCAGAYQYAYARAEGLSEAAALEQAQGGPIRPTIKWGQMGKGLWQNMG